MGAERRGSTRQRLPLYALLIANALSLVGSTLTYVALPWFVLETTGSAGRAGLTGAVLTLPSFVAGVFGGTLVDRFGFKRTIIAADLVSGLGIVAIPLLHSGPGLAFWQLLLFVFIGHLMDVPGVTARRSLLPELAKRSNIRLERVNTAYEASQELAFLLGPPLAGLLIVWIGASNVLWLDAATFAVSALLIAVAIPEVSTMVAVARERYLDGLRAGLRFLRREQLLLAMALSLMVTNFFGNPYFAVVLPVYAKEELNSARALGLMLGAFGGGAFLGMLFYGWIAYRLPRRMLWLSAYSVAAVMYWILLPGPPLPIIVAVLALIGFAGGPIGPLSVTIRHERIPAAMRGRVFSTFSAISMAATPVGIALGGASIDRFGMRWTIVLTAILYQIVGLAMYAVPAFRELNRRRHAE